MEETIDLAHVTEKLERVENSLYLFYYIAKESQW